MNLAQINVYRMTHVHNIPHILEHGITHHTSANRNPNFVSIGDVSLINTRAHKQVLVDNGDFLNFDAPSVTLGDFIPFYFGIKMPMLFVMQNGGNFVLQPTPAQEIIYLVCSVSGLITEQDSYYFSDGHGTDHLTTFYDKSKVNELGQIIDWAAVKAPYWGGQDNLNLKRKKQAEFLAGKDIAAKHIVGFVCYNNAAKTRLEGYGIKADVIKVIPNAYY